MEYACCSGRRRDVLLPPGGSWKPANAAVPTTESIRHPHIAVQPPPLDWAVVAAFYAAVHYVNAYLWERQRYEPHTHEARENAVARAVEVRAAYDAYARLRGLAYRARYVPLFQISRPNAQGALVDLDRVEKTVLAALQVTT